MGKAKRQQIKKIRTDMSALTVTYLPTDALKADPRNARVHGEKQIEKIMLSISEFGFVNPILASRDNTVIAGHARLEAARRLKLTSVPVIVLGHLSDAERTALMIADNRLSELSVWDEEMLRALLDEVRDADLIGTVGWDADEIGRILQSDGRKQIIDPDSSDLDLEPDPSITVTLRFAGEMWLGQREHILRTLESIAKKWKASYAVSE